MFDAKCCRTCCGRTINFCRRQVTVRWRLFRGPKSEASSGARVVICYPSLLNGYRIVGLRPSHQLRRQFPKPCILFTRFPTRRRSLWVWVRVQGISDWLEKDEEHCSSCMERDVALSMTDARERSSRPGPQYSDSQGSGSVDMVSRANLPEVVILLRAACLLVFHPRVSALDGQCVALSPQACADET